MSDENSAPDAGGEAAPVVAPANLDSKDSYSPEQAHEAYLKRINPPAESAKSAPAEPQLSDEDNADPVAEQAPGEEPEDAEPASEPPIERPRSWTKEEDAEWQSLPRAMQQKIVAREQERDSGLRRSQNEAADKLKGLTAKEQAAEQARQEYEAKLPALMQALHDTNAAQFSDIKTMDDVKRMAVEDPFRKIQWDTHQQVMQAANWELQQAETRKTQEQQTKWTDHVRTENQLFAEKVPEFADPAKAKELTQKAVEHLHDLGFSDAELAGLASGKDKLSIYDHRVQLLLHGNLKLSDIQKAKTVAVAKVVPAVQRPGVSSAKGPADNVQALRSKLSGSGSVDDAFALYQAKRRRTTS